MTAAEWQIVAFTVEMAVLSTALILPVGVALAWCLARLRWRGKALVETFVALPLVLPPVVTGLVLLKLFGRRGPVGHWFYSEFHFDIVFTWRAVTLALAVMSFPLLVWTARSAIEEVNPALEQIARTAGSGGVARIFHHHTAAGETWNTCGDRAGFRARAGRIRRDDHGGRQYSRRHNHVVHRYLPTRASR